LVYQKRLVRGVDADYTAVSINPWDSQFRPSSCRACNRRPWKGDRSLARQIKAALISERELQKARIKSKRRLSSPRLIFGQAMKVATTKFRGWRQMDGYLEGIRKVSRGYSRVARKSTTPTAAPLRR
jgi:hypothetical protein